jgi:uncharacterized membrane protein YgdD (TMEM256/DUF423 family)
VSSLTRRWIAIGAALGAIGVALGAFGAHGLSDFLEGRGYSGDDLTRRLEIFDTAIRYQLLHALALVVTGFALDKTAAGAWRFAAWSFLVGIIAFSGSLKILTFAGPQWNWLGMVAPIGGLALIAGWIGLAIGAFARTKISPVPSP